MGLDNTIWLAGTVAEAVVLGLLIYRRVWRLLPIFCIYCAFDLASNISGFVTNRFFPSTYTLKIYFLQTVVDAVLQFAVMVELAWSVLRPIRSSLPNYSKLVVIFLVFAAGAVIWPFATLPGLAHMPKIIYMVFRFQQTISILRIVFFVVLAACSQLLSIGWRDRELQVATGLGLYSLVSLAGSMMQAHQTGWRQYVHVNQFVIGAFLCSLIYWIFCFAQKQAERREFTPQMQNLLLAVAGAARANRAALSGSPVSDVRFDRKG